MRLSKLLWLLALLAGAAQGQVAVKNLPAGGSISGANLTICDQSSATYVCTFSQVLAFVAANISIPSTQITGLGTFAGQNYASPPAIGGITAAPGTFSTLTDSGITGLIQCVHASATGIFTGTGADCGSGTAGVSSFSGDGSLLSNSSSAGAVTATLANTGVGYGVWGNIGSSSGAPAYHALSTYPTAAFPTLNQNTTGTSANVTGTSNSTLTTLSALTSANGTTIPSSATLTQTIASGTSALGTGAITSGACATVVTTTATGVATTDSITWSFNADPTSTVGYQASANGMLTIISYPTSGNANFKVCNNTSASVTPGAVTLNWRVVR